MTELDPPELIPHDEYDRRLGRGDRIRMTSTERDVSTVVEATWGGWDASLLSFVSAEGMVLNLLEGRLCDPKVHLIERHVKPWPSGGTPILVTETRDETGEAGLPDAPFVALVTGERFLASRDGSWLDHWHKSFATGWQGLDLSQGPAGDYEVEVTW